MVTLCVMINKSVSNAIFPEESLGKYSRVLRGLYQLRCPMSQESAALHKSFNLVEMGAP